jgi:hypothetical protein
VIDIKNKALFAALAAAVIGTTLFVSTKAYATEEPNTNPMSQLVQKIADKFGLNKSDVQAVFDQDRADRKTAMEQKFETQLDQDVKDGKITEAQKQLIISKRKELETTRQNKMQNMQGKSKEEMKTAMEANKATMEAERKSLEDWAKQNGIDVKYVMGGFGMHGGPGRNGMGGPPSM